MHGFRFYHYIILFINIIIVAFMFILLGIKYDSLPDEIPNKYNFKGEIIGYTEKKVLYVMPSISAFITVLFFGLSFIPNLLWKVFEKYDILNYLKDHINNSWINYMYITLLCVNTFLACILVCLIYSIKISLIIIILFALAIVLINTLIPTLFFVKTLPLIKKRKIMA